MCLGCLYLLLSLFMFAWIITGSVFVFDNTECADEAPAVWYLAMVLVVINYLFWALTLLVCIFACCGVAILMGQAADELNEELAHHETAEEEAKQGKYEQV